MEAFTRLVAKAIPLSDENMDTDQVIPARFLRYPRSSGYADYLFHDLRYAPDRTPRPDFVFNQPAYGQAKILVANTNFASGSSREGAVYALVDSGIRCVIAPSFGDIFFNNCFKNGLLPVRLPAPDVAALRQLIADHPQTSVAVDLAAQTVRAGDGFALSFAVDPFWKMCLLQGLDDIGLTLRYRSDIEAFIAAYERDQPWAG